MLTTDTLPALLRAVCLRPHDTDVRLVYADALEESGDVERAEFIRVQIELAGFTAPKTGVICCEGKGPPAEAGRRKKCRCQPCVLRRRERELFDYGRDQFWFSDVCSHFAELRHGPVLGLESYDQKYIPNSTSSALLTARRGFVEEVACDLATWLTHGPQIVLASPVVAVTVSNVDVYTHEPPSPLRGCFVLRRDVGNELWSLIQPDDSQVVSPLYPDRKTALNSLSTTAIRWARIEAKLDVKCGRCDGDGKAHGSDRPFEWTGPGTYPGNCPVCHGTGYVPNPV